MAASDHRERLELRLGGSISATIAKKDLGGDGEAGISDDGKFQKYTLGTVFRPVPQVALKLDGSAHVQDFNGKSEFYPEIRISFSYLWGLQ